MTQKKETAPKVKVGGKISNGRGGFYREGTEIKDASADTLKSLKAKGLI